MSVYEALSLMIAFATLIVLVNNNKDNKKQPSKLLARCSAIFSISIKSSYRLQTVLTFFYLHYIMFRKEVQAMQSENKQTIANRKYRAKNREKTNQQADKRSGKLFILNYASEEDLQLFESYVQENT